MRSRQHALGLVFVGDSEPHEHPQHGAAKRPGQPRDILHRPRHEGPVRPAPAVGDEEGQVRTPVGPRSVRLKTSHAARGNVTLARQRATGGDDGAGGDAGDVAEQRPQQKQVAQSRLGMVSTICLCGTGARSVVSNHRDRARAGAPAVGAAL